MLLLFRGGIRRCRDLSTFPVKESNDEVFQAKRLHFLVIDYFTAQGKEVIIGSIGDERAYVELQLVKHLFSYIARGVHEITEQRKAFDRVEMLLGKGEVVGGALVELDVVHRNKSVKG